MVSGDSGVGIHGLKELQEDSGSERSHGGIVEGVKSEEKCGREQGIEVR